MTNFIAIAVGIGLSAVLKNPNKTTKLIIDIIAWSV